ncbi:MAG: TIGR02450 family Trp-rich protein [Pseudobacteriovorax sp.]|nr:TIGR02450 family Trp-rich protein [Pseudobacteriovorax sp.]
MAAVNARNLAINSQWTAVQPVRGWKHYRITGRRHLNRILEIELMAVCDKSIRFWVVSAALKDPEAWRQGWL